MTHKDTFVYMVWLNVGESNPQHLRSFHTWDAAQAYIKYMHHEGVYYTMEPVHATWEREVIL